MRKELLVAFIFLSSSSILTTIDVIADLSEGTSIRHVSLEVAVISIGMVGSLWIVTKWIANFRKQITRNNEDMAKLKLQAETWRETAQSHLRGLAEQIDRQFSQWSLTDAEKEVALLLIKGLSIKEIANIREVHEKTIRLQSSSLYKKSGVSGRAELAAFFLEDLLLPQRIQSESHRPV